MRKRFGTDKTPVFNDGGERAPMRKLLKPLRVHASADALQRTRIGTAINQQILPGDKARVLRAKKRAQRADLLGAAVAPGRIALAALFPQLLKRLAAGRQHAADVIDLRIGIK